MLKLQCFGHCCRESTHWKRPWCQERLRAGGDGDDRECNDSVTSLTQWTWVWANSKGWWKAVKPGMPQSMRLQRVGHDWVKSINNNGKVECRIECAVLTRVQFFAALWTVAHQLLCPWDFPGKNSGVSCHFLLQRSSQPRNWTWCLLHVSSALQMGSLLLSHQGRSFI